MRRKISAFDVAEYFIYLSVKEKNRKISNKKLQKLVYYAQAWTLVLTNKTLFSERIEAWIHGPAIPSLYRRYKKFGFSVVESQSKNFDPTKIQNREILDEVWRVYGKYDANYLEILTHQEEPWISARNEAEFQESSTNEISIQLMKEFYSQKLNELALKNDQEKNSKSKNKKSLT